MRIRANNIRFQSFKLMQVCLGFIVQQVKFSTNILKYAFRITCSIAKLEKLFAKKDSGGEGVRDGV